MRVAQDGQCELIERREMVPRHSGILPQQPYGGRFHFRDPNRHYTRRLEDLVCPAVNVNTVSRFRGPMTLY
jgi:hypothetical protein